MLKPRILIVDDDLNLAEILDSYFRVQHYDVVRVGWGEDAVRIANEQTIDLIILDIHLPDTTGFDVCRQLRLQRRTQHVPIIFLTEKRERVDKLQGLELGVIDYITKPFDIQELKLRVRNVLERSRRLLLVNPITELPEVDQLETQLSERMKRNEPWAVISVAVGGLGRLSDVHGYAAADDVMRALVAKVRSVLDEESNVLVTQLSADRIAVLTTIADAERIRRQIEVQVGSALSPLVKPKDGVPIVSLSLITHLMTRQDGAFRSASTVTERLLSEARS